MSFLAINGYVLPEPNRGLDIIVSTVVNGGRNTEGVTVGQRVGRDLYKINGLEWSFLTAAEWEAILASLAPFYVNVTFFVPDTGEKKTIKMYPSDRSAVPYYVDDNGKPTHFKDCKFNLIDTGE